MPREIYNKVTGPIAVRDDLSLYGIIDGDVTVEAGGYLLLCGVVTGTLTIKPGGKADLNGVVHGPAFNAGGTLEIRGVVRKAVETLSPGRTNVHRQALVNGIRH